MQIYQKLFKQETFFGGVILSIIFNVISKGILFLNSVYIATHFNIVDADIYFFVYTSVMLISFFINSIDSAIIIPNLMLNREKKLKKDIFGTVNTFFLIYFFIGITLGFLFYLGIDFYWHKISNFSKQDISNNKGVFIAGALLIPSILINSLQVSILSAYKYFTISSLTSAMVNSTSLGALYFSNKYSLSVGIYGFVVAYIILSIFLFLFMKRQLDWRFKISSLDFNKKLFLYSNYVIAGNAATLLFNYSNMLIISGLGKGFLSYYNYALQIINIPSNFIINQVSAVSGIKFNELAYKENYKELNNIFFEIVTLLLIALIPYVFFINEFSFYILKQIFLRGNFDENDIVNTSLFLKTLIFLIPFYIINSFFSRLIITFQYNKIGTLSQVFFNIVLVFSTYLCSLRYQFLGFSMSTLIIHYLYIVFFVGFFINKYLSFLKIRKLLFSIFLILLFNITMFFSLHALSKVFSKLVYINFIWIYPVLIIIKYKITKDKIIIFDKLIKLWKK
jgi:O-antigen/teichoic acid export membrane protein